MNEDNLKKLSAIQTAIKAPKGQTNKFGGYKYRSCEDILEALKPHLAKHESTVILSDEVQMIGERFYVVATVYFNGEAINKGYARECETRKGMDDAQLTGSCSSYARKYALAGAFLLDDTQDADSMDNSHQPASAAKATQPASKQSAPATPPKSQPKPAAKPYEDVNPGCASWEDWKTEKGTSLKSIAEAEGKTDEDKAADFDKLIGYLNGRLSIAVTNEEIQIIERDIRFVEDAKETVSDVPF